MGLTYLFGIVLAALSVLRPAPAFAAPLRAGGPSRRGIVAFAGVAVLLVLVALAQIRVLDHAAGEQRMPAWQQALPLAMFTGNGLSGVAYPHRLGAEIEALCVLQTVLLVVAWRLLRQNGGLGRPVIIIAALAGTCLAGGALHATLAGPDIFAYAGFALSPHPYAPDATPLPRFDEPISAMWGRPLPPSPYGPAWTALSRTIRYVHDLGAQLLLLRIVGLVALGVAIAALYVARRRTAALLVALDPTLYQIYVSEAHNDIVGIALLLVAFAARRRPMVAVACVVLAGAVKLPLLLIGLVVFATAPTLRARIVPSVAALVLGLGVSAVFGGRPYFEAIRRTSEMYPHTTSGGEWIAHGLLAALALGAIVVAVCARRFAWGLPWSFVAAGQFTAWQYLGWGIPYALLDETRGALYLATFPLTAFAATLVFNDAPGFDLGRVLGLAVLLVLLVLTVRQDGVRGGLRRFSLAPLP